MSDQILGVRGCWLKFIGHFVVNFLELITVWPKNLSSLRYPAKYEVQYTPSVSTRILWGRTYPSQNVRLTPEKCPKSTDLSQVTDKLYHIMLYTSSLIEIRTHKKNEFIGIQNNKCYVDRWAGSCEIDVQLKSF
jgi:hypothetical protein